MSICSFIIKTHRPSTNHSPTKSSPDILGRFKVALFVPLVCTTAKMQWCVLSLYATVREALDTKDSNNNNNNNAKKINLMKYVLDFIQKSLSSACILTFAQHIFHIHLQSHSHKSKFVAYMMICREQILSYILCILLHQSKCAEIPHARSLLLC